MSAGKIALYGGRGALGSVCVNHFLYLNWWVANIDLLRNDLVHCNIVVPRNETWLEQERRVLLEMGSALQSDKLDAVVCVAGGWAGGNAADSLTKRTELMWKHSVWTSSIAASLATHYLAPGGLLVLSGARAALYGTPGMIGYGMAKAAVHHLVKSLGQKKSGMPEHSSVIAILPDMLDTAANRRLNPHVDKKTWTPLPFVVDLIDKWVHGEDRPPNGSLVSLITADNVTRVMRLQEETDPSIIM